MASTYSPSLKIELIGNGDQSGVWGTTTNNNLGTLIEQAITGVQAITMSNTSYVMSNYNGVSDEARNAVLVVSGTNSSIQQIVAPLVNKLYIVTNNTSGGYAITIGGVTGTTVTIPNNTTAQVYCDGTNFYSSQTTSAGNFNINGTLTATGITDTGALSAASLTVSGATSLATGSISGIMTAPTATPGTNTTQLATTAFVAQNAVLTGSLLMWPTASAPTGYLLCDGASLSTTTYAALFAVVAYTFGGSGASFSLPDYRGKSPLGVSGSYALASTGGSADAVVVSHTHTASSVVTDAGHTHPLNQSGMNGTASGRYAFSNYDNSYGTGATQSATTGITVATTNTATGVSGTNANLQPYLAINFIIKT